MAHGCCPKAAELTAFDHPGMSLAGLLRLDSLFKGTTRPRPLAVLCAIDVVSQLLCQYGLTVAGSSLYVSLLPLLRSLYPPRHARASPGGNAPGSPHALPRPAGAEGPRALFRRRS